MCRVLVVFYLVWESGKLRPVFDFKSVQWTHPSGNYGEVFAFTVSADV